MQGQEEPIHAENRHFNTTMNDTANPAFGLIIVGDEILSGKRQDKHLSKVIELLSARGLMLSWSTYVGDDPRRITDTLRGAFAGGDIVFSCGGIGATPDDHTRQCAARALDVPLALHPRAKALILERMQDVAREKGEPYDPGREDNVHRLNMGVFPQGAQIIENPFNKIPGFSIGDVHFVPGFPVMAHPMIETLLDTRYKHLHHRTTMQERSVVVYGAMEATLTPLMEAIEREHAGVRIFSLPSVDHPVHGKHIELGVKGAPALLDAAYATLRQGLHSLGAELGPEMVR
jgi:molybdopterin-biosynthesis enzyme MoeA-like protein